MKLFVAVVLLAVCACQAFADMEAQPQQEAYADDAAREKKSYNSYAAPSYSAPSYGHGSSYGGASHGYGHGHGHSQSYGHSPSYGHESYGHSSYGHSAPSYGHESYGHSAPSYGHSSYGHATPSYGHASHGYSAPSYGHGYLGAANPLAGANDGKPEKKDNKDKAVAASEVEAVYAAIPEESEIELYREKKSTYGYESPAPAMKPGYATTHTYQSYAPTVPCAKNVLVSCSPSVAPVPCAAPHYGKGY